MVSLVNAFNFSSICFTVSNATFTPVPYQNTFHYSCGLISQVLEQEKHELRRKLECKTNECELISHQLHSDINRLQVVLQRCAYSRAHKSLDSTHSTSVHVYRIQ